jgi:hypothetical protein
MSQAHDIKLLDDIRHSLDMLLGFVIVPEKLRVHQGLPLSEKIIQLKTDIDNILSSFNEALPPTFQM